ncbi:hypothetical protein GTA08_BOTSDO00717 [Botryosphaeria dothidea]|uniref:Uncharacterized protein n=1 Tax=Botryosphaeria dothidea TaxID=55169 RepID=A0A8H4J513_9PEZI|nr:hypothetical protein GTA08_BOTSDO00717 [Botryosphaeria dothidea]
MLSWNWNDQRVIDALDALEHTRFGSDQELRSILAVILSTSNINTVQQDMNIFDPHDFNLQFWDIEQGLM